jgi:hypothetical protein
MRVNDRLCAAVDVAYFNCCSELSSGMSDDGGSTRLWNVGRQLFYTAVHPRRQFWTSYSPPWELEISQTSITFVRDHRRTSMSQSSDRFSWNSILTWCQLWIYPGNFSSLQWKMQIRQRKKFSFNQHKLNIKYAYLRGKALELGTKPLLKTFPTMKII